MLSEALQGQHVLKSSSGLLEEDEVTSLSWLRLSPLELKRWNSSDQTEILLCLETYTAIIEVSWYLVGVWELFDKRSSVSEASRSEKSLTSMMSGEIFLLKSKFFVLISLSLSIWSLLFEAVEVLTVSCTSHSLFVCLFVYRMSYLATPYSLLCYNLDFFVSVRSVRWRRGGPTPYTGEP